MEHKKARVENCYQANKKTAKKSRISIIEIFLKMRKLKKNVLTLQIKIYQK